MSILGDDCPFKFDIFHNGTGKKEIVLSGTLDIDSCAFFHEVATKELDFSNIRSANINLEKLDRLDDYGAVMILEIQDKIIASGGSCKIINKSEFVSKTFELLNFTPSQNQIDSDKLYSENIFIRVGNATFTHAYHLRYMVSFLGSVVLSFLHLFSQPKSLKGNDVVLHMQRVGVDAVPIVALISFLLGLIMAFVSSIQLKQFGASIYVASLVALSMVSELGPIMTAIIVAGRSGSAFAAEIGTMQISEEVDALFVMGFSPTRFLVIPRMMAAIIVVPLLTVFSNIFAIMGGLAISISMLDLTVSSYLTQTIKSLSLFELFWGGMKSIFFAALIAWVGCLRGFQVKGGAAEVGSAATSAVVSSIFLIILVDSIFAVIRSYWG